MAITQPTWSYSAIKGFDTCPKQHYHLSVKKDYAWPKDATIIDLAILNGEEAKILDYKTGKSAQYADKGQLELMALATFKHFPQIKVVRGGLLFVVANAFVKETYEIDRESDLWAKWLGEYKKLVAAHKNNVWNPKPSGLCKAHCAILECEHNGRA